MATDAERAQGIRRLYGLDGSPAQAQRGVLPTTFRAGAPDWENQIRKRLHSLLNPKEAVVGADEGQALVEAGIPLRPRPSGSGLYIDPDVSRESGLKAASGDAERAGWIRRLYGLDGSPAQVQRGVLPAQSRKGAPDWENQIRKRLHNLLKPRWVVGADEGQALVEAGIPLRPRPSGSGLYIDPAVRREAAGFPDPNRALPNPADVAAAAAARAPAGALDQPSHTLPSLWSIPALREALNAASAAAARAEGLGQAHTGQPNTGPYDSRYAQAALTGAGRYLPPGGVPSQSPMRYQEYAGSGHASHGQPQHQGYSYRTPSPPEGQFSRSGQWRGR